MMPEASRLLTETQDASLQDSGSWLQSLLTAGVGVYTAISQADTAKQTAKTNAQLQLANSASVANANQSAVSNKMLLIAGGAVAVGLVLVLAFRK